MHVETVIAGFGGQGILFLGRVLATAGMLEGYHVSWYPSYGPEMRGGTANCQVIISDEEIGSTISDHPHICIVMNEPSLRRFAPTIRPGGLLIMNSSLINQEFSKTGIDVLKIPANEIAGEVVGEPRTLNMVILGALVEYRPVVRADSVQKGLSETLQGKKRELLDMNLRAFHSGRDYVSKKSHSEKKS